MGKNIVVNKLDSFYDNHDKIQIPIKTILNTDVFKCNKMFLSKTWVS